MRAKPRLFRDPVHDIIAIAPDTADGRLLLELIDAREFQRLRRIRQLALNQLVYHGAEHSRFAHSMGVASVARRMCDQLARHVEVDEGDRMVTLAASLLHDVGHGPFSHALERVTGTRHELRSQGIIRHPDTDVHRSLAAVDPALPERVAACVMGRFDGPGYLGEVVSSQLDADRLDYILRDGHATGVKIGSFDLARILTLLAVDEDHLAVHIGAQEAVEGYLLARFHMYKQVYLHKTSRAAERMLEGALRRAAALRRDGYRFEFWPGGPFGDLLEGKELDDPEFARLDDFDVWVSLKRWSDEKDRSLADLSRGLVERKLWKTLVVEGEDQDRANELLEAARSIARVRGFDPEHHVLSDSSGDSPYEPYTGVETTRRQIRLIDGSGRSWAIEDRSEVVKMLGRLHHAQRVICCHPDLREALERLER